MDNFWSSPICTLLTAAMLKDSIPTNTATWRSEEEHGDPTTTGSTGRRAGRGAYDERSEPLLEDERSVDFLEEAVQDAVGLSILNFWQSHTAADVQAIPLSDTDTTLEKRGCGFKHEPVSVMTVRKSFRIFLS